MNRKLPLPILAIALAILACNIQTGSITSPAPVITTMDTAVPSVTTTSTPGQTVTATDVGGLTLDMLRNGTYFAPAYEKTVTLVNGAYSENSSGGYNVQMLDVYAFGDLNGDGIEDAAIILVENDGGSGQFVSLIVIYDSGGSPVQAGQSTLGDRVQVNSMNISTGVIHLDMLVQAPNDPMCCPSLAEKQSYWMISGHLWLMRVTTTSSGTERTITVNSPANWAGVTSPFSVTGDVSISPFENTLAYRIFLPDETKVNESSLLVSSAGMGTPGTFSQTINLTMAGITGPVIIQFVDESAADGSTLAMGSVLVIVH